MKIIYNCFGGSHSSVTAAAMHLGLISENRVPTAEELKAIPYFDEQLAEDHGDFKYMGEDEQGNQVYVVGRRNLGSLFEPLIHGIARIFSISPKEYLIVNTMPCVNWIMVLGGILSRKLGMVSLGRPIVIYGTQQAHGNFVKLVNRVKTTILPAKENSK
ncbi:MAG: DUF3189 family protein [Thermoanaerobacteraceae bacterium]|nr:DUF3189 family protein [Thermoanaerobacteraceae bacterium]